MNGDLPAFDHTWEKSWAAGPKLAGQPSQPVAHNVSFPASESMYYYLPAWPASMYM